MINIELSDSPTHSGTNIGGAAHTAYFDGAGGLDATANVADDPFCTHCGKQIAEYANGWLHEDNNSRYCDEDEDPANMDEDDLDDIEEESVPWTGWGQWEAEHYTAEPKVEPVINWVGFTIRENGEQARVQISTGDPRGCLEMKVWRRKNDDGSSTVMLNVPHVGMPEPHANLRGVGPGTYELG